MLTGEVFYRWLDYHPVELMCWVDLLYSKDRWVAILYYGYRWVDQPYQVGPTIVESASMTVWKNDVPLGVMQAEGLSGPLCWAINLWDAGTSARINSAPLLEL